MERIGGPHCERGAGAGAHGEGNGGAFVGPETAYEKSLHPSLIEGWKGGVNLGFAMARGNSATTNLTTGFAPDRKTLTDEITLYELPCIPATISRAAERYGELDSRRRKYDRNFTSVFRFRQRAIITPTNCRT